MKITSLTVSVVGISVVTWGQIMKKTWFTSSNCIIQLLLATAENVYWLVYKKKCSPKAELRSSHSKIHHKIKIVGITRTLQDFKNFYSNQKTKVYKLDEIESNCELLMRVRRFDGGWSYEGIDQSCNGQALCLLFRVPGRSFFGCSFFI